MYKLIRLAGHTMWLASLLFLIGCLKRPQLSHQVRSVTPDQTGVLITPSKISKEHEVLKVSRLAGNKPAQSITAHPQTLSKSSVEARLIDVPIRIGSKLIDASRDDKGNSRLTYTVSGMLQEVWKAYSQDLKGAGWQIRQLYTDQVYVVLEGKKPNRRLILSCEQKNAGWFSSDVVELILVVAKYTNQAGF